MKHIKCPSYANKPNSFDEQKKELPENFFSNNSFYIIRYELSF